MKGMKFLLIFFTTKMACNVYTRWFTNSIIYTTLNKSIKNSNNKKRKKIKKLSLIGYKISKEK
jgi:hypothetical protein